MQKIFKYSALFAAVAMMTAITANAQANDQSSTSGASATHAKTDHKAVKFIKQAAEDNDTEIALGELGNRKAQNSELKSLSQELKQDHMQANQQLQPIAQNHGVKIDQPLQKKKLNEVTKLEKEQAGQKFDQDLAIILLKGHQKAIKSFQEAAEDVQAPDVKQYAETTLPVLRKHLEHAAAAAKAVGVNQSTIAKYTKELNNSMGGTSEPAAGRSTSKGAGARKLQNHNEASGTQAEPQSQSSQSGQ